MTPSERFEHLKKKREHMQKKGGKDDKNKPTITEVSTISSYQAKAAVASSSEGKSEEHSAAKSPAPDDFVKSFLGSQHGEPVKTVAEGTYIVQKGKVYRIGNKATLHYHVAKQKKNQVLI